MADIGSTTRVSIRRQGAQPSVAASGPTPGTPPTSTGLYARARVSAPTADLGVTVLRSNSGADYLLAPPTSPPVFGSFSPGAGDVSRTDAVTVTVTDDDGFGQVLVWAELADGTLVMVYDGSTFSASFDAGSSISGTTTKTIVVQHDAPGWTDDYTLRVQATDSLGASASASSAYTITDPPAPPDTTQPTVTVVSPTPPGPIGRNDAVRLQVTDAGGLRRVRLSVTMGDEQYVIHNGYSFRPRYAQGSTVAAISGGFEYVVLRAGGWLSAPTFEVDAIDLAGNER